MSILRKIIHRGPREKHKPEKIIQKQKDNSDHLSVHGPSTNTGRYILKENLEGLVLLEDLPLGKTILDIEQQFVHCLEEVSIPEGEVK